MIDLTALAVAFATADELNAKANKEWLLQHVDTSITSKMLDRNQHKYVGKLVRLTCSVSGPQHEQDRVYPSVPSIDGRCGPNDNDLLIVYLIGPKAMHFQTYQKEGWYGEKTMVIIGFVLPPIRSCYPNMWCPVIDVQSMDYPK